jgi:hypothetical protein
MYTKSLLMYYKYIKFLFDNYTSVKLGKIKIIINCNAKLGFSYSNHSKPSLKCVMHSINIIMANDNLNLPNMAFPLTKIHITVSWFSSFQVFFFSKVSLLAKLGCSNSHLFSFLFFVCLLSLLTMNLIQFLVWNREVYWVKIFPKQ